MRWNCSRRLSGLSRFLVAAGICLLTAANATAQLPQARLTAVFPPGGQRGTTVDITSLSGTDLDDPTQILFSHPGITAAPKTQDVNGTAQPVPGQFTVTIAADCPIGTHDIRVRGVFGFSNPRTFVVGAKKEVLEVEPNNEYAKATPLELNTTLNGQSNGGADLDFYKLTLAAGQKIVITCQGQLLDSRMAPSLELIAPNGRRVAWRYGAAEDPILFFTAPQAGDFVLKVHDFVYGGGAEYAYRLSAHTSPHIDFVLPASGLAGATSEFTLYGRNLPGGQPSPITLRGEALEMLKVQIAMPADDTILQPAKPATAARAGSDGISYVFPGETPSNPMTIWFASAPTGIEVEPNDTIDKPQVVTAPIEITGQFQARGDIDYYQFDAKAGDVFWIEGFGERNGTLADPYIIIDQVKRNDKGEASYSRIAALDDDAVNAGGLLFNTASDDPAFRFAAPADGTFLVSVRDRTFESRGDAKLVYRLAIRKESHDFRLVVVPPFPNVDPNQTANPWELGLRKGDNATLTVVAFRRDGYNGVIDVKVEGLPPGVTCAGAAIGESQKTTTLVFISTEQAADWAGTIKITGQGRIEDQAAVKALAASEATLKAAAAAIAAPTKAVADAAAALLAATDVAAKAKEALDKDAANEALKKALEDAVAKQTSADAAHKAAVAALGVAEKALADATAAVAAAKTAQVQAAKTVVREARSGTLVWPAQPQSAPLSRLAYSVGLSVTGEVAPFQLTTETARFEVNQSRQILIPVKLLKRAGFDEAVPLTFPTPPANVQVENKPIEKGKADAVYRIFVQNNVAPGTYTVTPVGQAQVSYKRHPDKEIAASAQKAEAEKTLAAATAALKAATDAKAAADKKATDTAAVAKAAADEKPKADKVAADADVAQKAATEEAKKAQQALTDAEAAVKAATDAKAAADKAAADAEAAAKAAVDAAAKAKADADAKTDDKALQDAKTAAETAAAKAAEDAKKAAEAKVAADAKLAEVTELAKKSTEAKAVADKKATDTTEALKKAVDAKAVAEKLVVDTAAAATKAVEEKAVTDKAMIDADAANKAATAAKTAADQKATAAANVSKPQNLNLVMPVTSLVLVVKQGPATLAVAPADGGNLKKGATVAVKVTVNRVNGFKGPVTLSFPVPPGIAGVSAAEVVVPAEMNEGTLVIQAAGDATAGQIPNAVIRALMEFEGAAAVDQPVAITVQ